ncbi:MAG: (Fe-S)-binding protein [Syntrophobacterales bacterium]|nr:MAG: (Fe-S)-binding protein [Syntrophobacterales bacterium]
MIPKSIAEEFDQCIKCGLCQATCPVFKDLLLEKFNPRGKIQLARYYSQGKLDLSDHYRDIFAKCLLCGACVVTCPSGVDLNKVFVSMREEITTKRGLHPKMEEVVRSLLVNHNISDEDNAERGGWRDFLKDLPEHMYQKDRAEVVYFVGCVASFFPMAQTIPQNLVRILESADVDFTILAGEEWCCGFPLIGAGVPEKAREMAEHNLAKVRELGAKKVVFSCPSCYRTWHEYYETDLELFHSTQLIERLIKDGAIRLGEVKATVTYHDPCDLGRNGGVYDAPRQILKSIPGITLVELENNRAQSVCCGGGGNLEMVDSGLTGTVAQNKIEEIKRTGAKTVVTSCQQCIRTIKGRARRQKADLTVYEITELVLQAISRG